MTVRLDVSRLLAVAGISADAPDLAEDLAEELARDMSTRSRTGASSVLAWAAGRPLESGAQLRALLAVLPVPRQRVYDLIAPALLLPALWCPALGDELARLRVQSGLSHEDLASASGVSVGSIVRWEKSAVLPRFAGLDSLLAVLGVSAADLLVLGDWPPAELPIGQRPAFATWLVKQCEEHNLSQSALARKLGSSQCVVQAWMAGRTYPQRSTWKELAAKLRDAGMPITTAQLRDLQIPERVAPADLEALPPVARMLAEARQGAALCRETAAARCRVELGTWRKWENGCGLPKAEQWPAIRTALELSVEQVTDTLEAARAEDRRDLGAWIRHRRAALGMTNPMLARAIGVHRNHVHRWESGYLAVPERSYEDLAGVLDVSVEELYERNLAPAPVRVAAGRALRERRLALGLTQDQVAAGIGASQWLVSTLETGAAPIPERVHHYLDTVAASASVAVAAVA